MHDSLIFGHLAAGLKVIFGYRAIADLTCDKIGSHFPIWPPSSLGKRDFVWENCGTYLFSVDFDPLWGPY